MKWARISASRPMESRQQSARGSPWTSNVSGFQGYIHIGDQQSRYTSVSLRVRSSSRVYIHAFFLKKKEKKSTSLCLMFAFYFFFFVKRKKGTKDFPSVRDTGFKYGKKRKKKMRGFCYWRKKGNGNGTGNVEGSSSISKWFRIR